VYCTNEYGINFQLNFIRDRLQTTLASTSHFSITPPCDSWHHFTKCVPVHFSCQQWIHAFHQLVLCSWLTVVEHHTALQEDT